MARARRSDAGHRLAEHPSLVEITILVDRAHAGLLPRIVALAHRGRHRAVVALALFSLAITLVAAALFGSGASSSRPAARAARASGSAGVAAAYGYPLPCLSIMISRRNPAYARADFNRAVPCGRYDGSTTAIFQRVHGSWRPVVDAVTYSCPVAGLPRPVQTELGVCP